MRLNTGTWTEFAITIKKFGDCILRNWRWRNGFKCKWWGHCSYIIRSQLKTLRHVCCHIGLVCVFSNFC